MRLVCTLIKFAWALATPSCIHAALDASMGY